MAVDNFGKVAVLLGGDSAEREVSLRSGDAVLSALLQKGVDAIAFDPAKRPLADLAAEQVQAAVIMLHGRGGEDGSIQGALQNMGVPYSGSGVLGCALAMDKIRSKQIFQSLGLPTPNYAVVAKADFQAHDCQTLFAQFNGAIMVKPAQEGSSIGMSKVSDANALNEALQKAFEYDSDVLLEQYIEGQEFTVSILNGQALPSITMRTPRTFYDYTAKYQASTTEYHCPSGLDEASEATLAELALKAFNALAAEGWGRVDFMQDQAGQFYLLEANTAPGMTEKSLVPLAAKQAGYSFADLCIEVLRTCSIKRG